MEALNSFASALAAKIVENTFSRCFRSANNVENLQTKIQELQTTKETIQTRVNAAKQNGQPITDDVQTWLNQSASVSQEALTFQQNYHKNADIKCFHVSLPNVIARKGLSSEAEKKAEEIESLIQNAGDRFLNIVSRPVLQSCIAVRDGYMEFESRKKVLEEIVEALSCVEVRKVGVYGTEGVGKTMIAEEVARISSEKKQFSEVVFVTVASNPDLSVIQQAVAEKIGLNFNGIKSIGERADRLKRLLKQRKSTVIILDDLRDKLDLRELGLNFDNDQQGCKILMTSRYVDVTRKYMGGERNISVGFLTSDEATSLFVKIVGTDVAEQEEFQRLMDDLVKECGGLPRAINKVASEVKGKELSIWSDALNRLKNSGLADFE